MDVDEPTRFGLQIVRVALSIHARVVISALVLSCMSGVLAEKLNFTQRFQRRFLPQLQPPGEMNNVDPWRTSKLSSSLPTAGLRDIFYLPEDDYSNNDLEDVLSNDEDLPEIRRDDRNSLSSTEYRSLCQTKTKTVQLTDDQHEYQPPHFHEVYCKSYSFAERVQALARPAQQMCAHPSFHCVQRSKTLFMVRRRWDSDCWEPFSRQVASGCECMWPVTTLGDITGHY
ncbi:uncharacterized protein LOC105687054 isoform X2 [Athalia rosae]|uniref:uncharacterized protein LOC105687054 isoform X2 n=1 Tax=Athalia rosae TaxID=37344 RepID=UPI0020347EDD|nr:uncharacterized protein LOC105687054 isoform X2 [Athalia rosae]